MNLLSIGGGPHVRLISGATITNGMYSLQQSNIMAEFYHSDPEATSSIDYYQAWLKAGVSSVAIGPVDNGTARGIYVGSGLAIKARAQFYPVGTNGSVGAVVQASKSEYTSYRRGVKVSR